MRDRTIAANTPTAANRPNCRCGVNTALKSDRNPAAVVREVITTGENIASIVARIAARLSLPLAISSWCRFRTCIPAAIPIDIRITGRTIEMTVNGTAKMAIAPIVHRTARTATRNGIITPRQLRKHRNRMNVATRTARGIRRRRSSMTVSMRTRFI